MRRLLLLAAVLLASFVGAALGQRRRRGELTVEVLKHDSCQPISGIVPKELAAPGRDRRKRTRITFPGSRESRLEQIPDRHGRLGRCFLVRGGTVTITEPGLKPTDTFQVHTEIRFGINGQPEPCTNRGADGCGGVGSCVHCNVCDSISKYQARNSRSNVVRLYKGRRRFECRKGLEPGPHNDISLKLCLPDRDGIMQLLDDNPERAEVLWEKIINAEERGRRNGLPVIVFAKIFNRPINRIRSRRILQDRLYGSKRGMIGCHWLLAKVYEK